MAANTDDWTWHFPISSNDTCGAPFIPDQLCNTLAKLSLLSTQTIPAAIFTKAWTTPALESGLRQMTNSGDSLVFYSLTAPNEGGVSVHEHLASEWGTHLNWPSYTKVDDTIGYVTRVYPGIKENGAIFSHPNAWPIIAETMLGRGERAMEYYDTIAPYHQNDKIETRGAEPYVYVQFIYGRDHEWFGKAQNPWLTGTAGWMYTAATKYILGVRLGFDDLIVDPCIPAAFAPALDGGGACGIFWARIQGLPRHAPAPNHYAGFWCQGGGQSRGRCAILWAMSAGFRRQTSAGSPRDRIPPTGLRCCAAGLRCRAAGQRSKSTEVCL